MNVTVIGTGYVGLVAGTCLSTLGHAVTCLDTDPARIAALQAGTVPFYEPGLPEVLARTTLRFTTSLPDAVPGADLVFIAIGTPSRPDGALDTGPLFSLATTLQPLLTARTLVVLKSTVPPGTTDALAAQLRPATVAFNPEFLREGHALHDFRHPARILLGTLDPHAQERLTTLYAPLGAPLLTLAPRAAELAKLAANAMLATRISFMNELGHLAAHLGVPLPDLERALGADPRIGPAFLKAGLGFGGSCLPKDLDGLRALGPTPLLDSVRLVNSRLPELLVERVAPHSTHVAVWGLSFNPDTDDLRGAPALEVIQRLLTRGARVTAFDPAAMPAARRHFGSRVDFAESAEAALAGADALVVCTEWEVFRQVAPQRVAQSLRGRLVVDARGCLDRAAFAEAGLEVVGFPA